MRAARGTTGGTEAQTLFARWLKFEGWQVAEAAKRVKFQTTDLFGCLDALALLALDDEGGDTLVWGAQVTTAAGRNASSSERKRKLEAVAWPSGWRISLVNHERVPDPANRARSMDYWRVQDLALVAGAAPWVRAWAKPVAVSFCRAAVEEAALAPKREREARELEALRLRVAKIEEGRS